MCSDTRSAVSGGATRPSAMTSQRPKPCSRRRSPNSLPGNIPNSAPLSVTSQPTASSGSARRAERAFRTRPRECSTARQRNITFPRCWPTPGPAICRRRLPLLRGAGGKHRFQDRPDRRLGIGAQWIAWRFRLPSVVLLALAGILDRPGHRHPRPGTPTSAICSGRYRHRRRDHPVRRRADAEFPRDPADLAAVRRMITIGAPLGWAARHGRRALRRRPHLADCDDVRRHSCRYRPDGDHAPVAQCTAEAARCLVLRWEGIINDPIGALFAVSPTRSSSPPHERVRQPAHPRTVGLGFDRRDHIRPRDRIRRRPSLPPRLGSGVPEITAALGHRPLGYEAANLFARGDRPPYRHGDGARDRQFAPCQPRRDPAVQGVHDRHAGLGRVRAPDGHDHAGYGQGTGLARLRFPCRPPLPRPAIDGDAVDIRRQPVAQGARSSSPGSHREASSPSRSQGFSARRWSTSVISTATK